MSKIKNDLDIFLEGLTSSQISHNNMWAEVEKRLVASGQGSGTPRKIIDVPANKHIVPSKNTSSRIQELPSEHIMEIISTESISYEKKISTLEEQIVARERSIKYLKSAITDLKNKKE
jgi:hypothetical protein